ncbi:nucleoside triphosphate pyrophosphohydrolase [bacterium]|nr:MAG: nucleoside triphosphate pyrophosphohydrolase [bacterium]
MLPLPSEGIAEGTILLPETSATPLGELVYIVDRLLGPGGCPWDQEQTHETLRKHLIEETYETVDAIDAGDLDLLREELGDLLLQPIMHAQIEKAAGGWDIDAVARGIVDKLVRRHPHVFGDVSAEDSDTVLRNWDAIKKTEGKRSALSGVPRSMPALTRALSVSKRAARAGFEWPSMEGVLEKLDEEEREVREALASGDSAAVEGEIGDLLFTVVNVARWAKVDPEEALRGMLDRFTVRFERMEALASAPLEELDAESWDLLWNRAKAEVG